MKGDAVDAGFDEVGGITERLVDHQMRVEEGGGRAAGRGADGRAEADVGDEMAVHDVEMEEVGAGEIDIGDLGAELGEVGREDRGASIGAVELKGLEVIGLLSYRNAEVAVE